MQTLRLKWFYIKPFKRNKTSLGVKEIIRSIGYLFFVKPKLKKQISREYVQDVEFEHKIYQNGRIW